jgi:hypothetical protein
MNLFDLGTFAAMPYVLAFFSKPSTIETGHLYTNNLVSGYF